MQLDNLTIVRVLYGPDKGKLRGTVRLSAGNGPAVEVPIDGSIAVDILRIVSRQISGAVVSGMDAILADAETALGLPKPVVAITDAEEVR